MVGVAYVVHMTTAQTQHVAEASIAANVTRVVKVLMALDGIDQQTLAQEIGVDPPTISRLFKGTRRWKLENIERLAELFNTPPSYFLEPVGSLVRRAEWHSSEQYPRPPDPPAGRPRTRRTQDNQPRGCMVLPLRRLEFPELLAS